MKNLFIYLLCAISTYCIGQSEEVYSFYVHMDDYRNAPEFSEQNDEMKYVGDNTQLKRLFDAHTITNFKQAFPASPRDRDLNVFYLETTGKEVVEQLKSQFSTTFTLFEEFSGRESVLQSYPDDYGPTSPASNSGVFQRSDLDYQGAPAAWDITTGIGTTVVMSDGRLKTDDMDFEGKWALYDPNLVQYWGFDINNLATFHGTATASYAVGQGDNGYGSTGVCYDCDVIMTRYAPAFEAFNNICELAQMGYRIFNMSWAYDGYVKAEQDMINTIVEEYDAVLVAAAGNRISYQTETDFYHARWDNSANTYVPKYTGEQIQYPAAYDNVISVSTMMHSWEINDPIAPPIMFWGNGVIASGQSYVKDSFSPNVDITDPENPIALKFNGFPRLLERNGVNYLISPNGITTTNMSNSKVDMLASLDLGHTYWKFAELGIIEYFASSGTTSGAAPYVAGTAALMITANPCLSAPEVDQILKLTTKDIEHDPMNQLFFGKIGAGKLEIGDAVIFSDEIGNSSGHAWLKDHIFYRWEFNLHRINNKLSLENFQFIGDAKAHFKARNSIELLEGTLLEPGELLSSSPGFTLLEIDPTINNNCTPLEPVLVPKTTDKLDEEASFGVTVSPNPSNGIFEVKLDQELAAFDYEMYNFSQVKLFEDSKVDTQNFIIKKSHLTPGIYFLKVISNGESVTVKVVVNE